MTTLPLQAEVGIVPISEALMVATWFTLIFGGMGYLGLGIRSGRFPAFRRAANWLEGKTGIAGWAALPGVVTFVALIIGSGGMLWDVNQHIENGRDLGLISQPSHVLAVIGLTTMVCAAFLSLVLAEGRPGTSAVPLSRTWFVPPAGLAAFLGFGTTIIIFPLDDIWHRIFGLDVSLWSPIHFVIVGAALAGALSTWFLLVSGAEAINPGNHSVFARRLEFAFPALLIIFAPAMVDEWTLGLPQAAPGYEPVLLATSLFSFVYLRSRFGRGAAVAGWLVYVALAAVMIGYVLILGFALTKMPLMLGYGLGVELAALLVGTAASWRFAVTAGLLGAVVGTAVEFGWARLLDKPIPWETYMLADAAPWILVGGVGAALMGVYVGHVLGFDRVQADTAVARRFGAAGIAATVAALTFIAGEPGGGGTATITSEISADGTSIESVAVRFEPASIGQRTDWLTVGSYQGGGLEMVRLQERADGSWYADGDFPITGTWKTVVRLSKDGDRSAVPVRMPADQELGLPEIPAELSVTRDVVNDLELIQRERRPDTPAWLWNAGLIFCFGLYLGLLLPVCWTLRRMAATPVSPRRREKQGAAR